MTVVARLAPSPTGAQHFGNARTYLIAWLSARAQQGAVRLRIENIDSPRVKSWAVQEAMDDLRWLGLTWDGEPVIQTDRVSLYEAALQQLRAINKVYPCTCTRSDIEAAASAPHFGQEPVPYPGFCAHRLAADANRLTSSYAWRFRTLGSVPTEPYESSRFNDLVAGEQECDVFRQLGDFVVGKSDGTPSYQLAVVVDDHEMGMTEVVRGDDLLPSAHRQLQLFQTFRWTAPQFAHVPLVVGTDGRRLAKRHGDTRISILRDRGISAERLIGMLAWSCGLRLTPEPVAAAELVSSFQWKHLHKAAFCLTPEIWESLLVR